MSRQQQQPASKPFSLATLYCPVCDCENLEAHQLCQACQAPLPKRYLRVIWPENRSPLDVGQLLGGRFLVRGQHLVLDTQPGDLPPFAEQRYAPAEAYLKLFPQRLHIPQVYGLMTLPEPTLLLELGPWSKVDIAADHPLRQLPLSFSGLTAAVPLTQAWSRAGVLRKLNWLWQIVSLWEPLTQVSAEPSLMVAENLRVEGPIVRLVQLYFDKTEEPINLQQLAQAWQQFLPFSESDAQQRLAEIWQNLPPEPKWGVSYLAEQLQAWIAEVAAPYTFRFNLATQTDQGPRRKRNEDNCYPASGTVALGESQVLTVVCDGVGGHAGGDVASGLGIQTFVEAAEELSHPDLIGIALEQTLDQVIRRANDVIACGNDAEGRQERQRMGTTLVAALTRRQQIYLAHVGDSRAYWITRYGCYQVTVDDDVACREVRLGLSSYRSALEQPYSGSLIQALGMGPAMHLHPTIQSLVLDEDCLFLLCSDGLSDLDRVEQNWQALLLPLLDQDFELSQRREDLITMANTLNGHDNVTVSLIHCHVVPPDGIAAESDYLALFYPQIEEFSTDALSLDRDLEPDHLPIRDREEPAAHSWSRAVMLLLICGVILLGSYWAWYTYSFSKSDQEPSPHLSQPE